MSGRFNVTKFYLHPTLQCINGFQHCLVFDWTGNDMFYISLPLDESFNAQIYRLGSPTRKKYFLRQDIQTSCNMGSSIRNCVLCEPSSRMRSTMGIPVFLIEVR